MSIADWFIEGFGAAITDIRQKMVEEPWFGQVTTPAAMETQPSFAEALGWAESAPERDRQNLARDHGQDQARTIDHDR